MVSSLLAAGEPTIDDAIRLLQTYGLIVCHPDPHYFGTKSALFHHEHHDESAWFTSSSQYDGTMQPLLTSCSSFISSATNTHLASASFASPSWSSSSSSSSLHRYLEDILDSGGGGGGEVEEDVESKLLNGLAALFCVCLAAVAAGLTLGLLGLDPLVLRIKERAGDTMQERRIAKQLLPIVQQHHRLLVTLLLMNSIANEALPIFLEAVVSPSVAIVLSVTLVLFFGEIIPSAIFTGPNQLLIASRLTPLVNTAMFLLSPLAVPIAKLLDYILHDDEEYDAYNRGELSALIRIQYEQRLAQKRKRKEERRRARKALLDKEQQQQDKDSLRTVSIGSRTNPTIVGALDFWRPPWTRKANNTTGGDGDQTNDNNKNTEMGNSAVEDGTTNDNHNKDRRSEFERTPSYQSYDSRGIIRAMKNRIEHMDQAVVAAQAQALHSQHAQSPEHQQHHHHHYQQNHMVTSLRVSQRPSVALSECSWDETAGDCADSIMLDEVMMVEGALQMKNKVAMDLMQPKRLTFRLPYDTILNERNMVKIYASGFSRIPVYRSDVGKQAICGVLITKQLIVVNPDDNRPISTLPLYIPSVVSPSTSLVDLLNILQMGGSAMKGGHLSLVCANPTDAQNALKQGQPIPESAGWMGVVTLEDVLEALLQEEIYDEFDDREEEAKQKLARNVWMLWTKYKRRKSKNTSVTTKKSQPQKQSSKSLISSTGSSIDAIPPTIPEASSVQAPSSPSNRQPTDEVALEEGLVASETTSLLKPPS